MLVKVKALAKYGKRSRDFASFIYRKLEPKVGNLFPFKPLKPLTPYVNLDKWDKLRPSGRWDLAYTTTVLENIAT